MTGALYVCMFFFPPFLSPLMAFVAVNLCAAGAAEVSNEKPEPSQCASLSSGSRVAVSREAQLPCDGGGEAGTVGPTARPATRWLLALSVKCVRLCLRHE